MKIAVIVFPGTNCEIDTKYAFEKLNQEVVLIWHKVEKLPQDIDLVVLPGGFSYGDYLRSAAIAKFSPIMKAIFEYAKNGGKILGICNGFQMLLEMKLLDGAMRKNENIHFIAKFHHLKVVTTQNPFLKNCQQGEILNIPIAHGEGNYYIDEKGLENLKKNNQILLTYCDEFGNDTNANGSVEYIAGICNKEKNIFGLMPHPERAIDECLGSTDGLKMLSGLLS